MIAASGQNTIDVELDSASVKAGSFGGAGGVIYYLSKDSVNRISVKIKNYCNVTTASGWATGGIIFNLEFNTSLDLSATIDTLNIDCGGSEICGGIIAQTNNIRNVKTDIKASLIYIFNNALYRTAENIGVIYGFIWHDPSIYEISNQFENNNIQIDNVIIRDPHFQVSNRDKSRFYTASILYVHPFVQLRQQQIALQKVTLIRGMHVDIQAKLSAIGVGKNSDQEVQKAPPIYLLFINGTLSSPNHIWHRKASHVKGR